ncbi:MAG: TonB-dependent receptor [Pseudomonadota bacterium]
MFKRNLFAAAGAAALVSTQTAVAQLDSADQDQEARQDTIIVTGQKIARSLQDTPESVAVVTSIDIENQNINDLSDAIARTANLSAFADDRGFSIRGIDSENVSGAGLSDLATIYVDGAPLSRDATRGGPLNIWDVEQVEFLRGPQSTLQGRNALAGAIIVNTTNPSYEWSGRARAVATSEINETRFGVAFGGPIIDEQLAFRIAAEIAEEDGIVENITLGGNDDERETSSIRGKLLIEPNAIPDLKVLLSYTHDDRKFGDNIASLAGADPEDDRQIASNRMYQDDTTYDLGVASIEYDLNDAWSLKSVTTYSQLDRERSGDSDRTPADLEFFDQTFETESITQEFLLNYQSDRWEAVFGAYASQIDTDQFFDTTFTLEVVNNFDLGPSVAGLVAQQLIAAGVPPAAALAQGEATAAQVVPLYAGGFLINANQIGPVSVDTYAVFSDLTYQLTDNVRLFGGFRYDVEEQAITTGNTVSVITPLPDPAAFPPLAPVLTQVNALLTVAALDATEEEERVQSPSFDAFLPKFGIGWDIDDKRSLNFVVQRGYRTGGVGINSATASSYTFDAEFTWNYELSFRSQWLDDRLTLNANAFFNDWTDQQVNIQLSANQFDVETQNAGASEVYGFEIETEYEINDEFNVYASIGVAESEFNEFCAFTTIENFTGLTDCQQSAQRGRGYLF